MSLNSNLQAELAKSGVLNSGGKKRNTKWFKGDANPQLKPEELIKKASALPVPLYKSLSIFKTEFEDLTQFMTTQFSYESILIYGKYTKTSRLIS